MNRREFIKRTSSGSLGIFLSGFIIQCSSRNISLENILGKNSRELFKNINLQKIGNDYLSYLILEKGDFKHHRFTGKQVLVFCQKENIIGFTIQIKGSDTAKPILDELDKTYSNKKKIFENEFGTKYQWDAPDKRISLCYTKEYPELPEYTFYSEYQDGENLIIF